MSPRFLNHLCGPLVMCYLVYLYLVLVLRAIRYSCLVHPRQRESLRIPIMMAMRGLPPMGFAQATLEGPPANSKAS